jgi:YD repeat-containing protein
LSNVELLAQEVGAVAQTTTHGYDGNGNRLTTTDPLDRGTANTYDALNRLLTVTDPSAAKKSRVRLDYLADGEARAAAAMLVGWPDSPASSLPESRCM